MKCVTLFLAACVLSFFAQAQHTVQLKNLWAKPQVHVLFDGYSISFTVKDIDRAIVLLNETGDTTYGIRSGLDPSVIYKIELYPDLRMEYRSSLQALLQKGVGAFLLTAGHAEIIKGKRKKVREITVDIGELTIGENDVVVRVYDPGNKNKIIFSGRMRADMYNKDLGID